MALRHALRRSKYGFESPRARALLYEQLGRVTPVIETLETSNNRAVLDERLNLLTASRTYLPR